MNALSADIPLQGQASGRDMRTALTALGLAVAIAASWSPALATQTEEPYGGPRTIKFEANGAMSPTLRGSIDLIDGTADLVGPCGRGIKSGAPCGPSDQQHLALSPPDLTKLRFLAIEIRTKGLFDTVCIEQQRRETELADLRQKKGAEKKQAEWKRQHPLEKVPAPNFIPFVTPPSDPYYASLQIEDVGTVVSVPEFGNRKSDARCLTRTTQTLWNMIISPYAQTWPSSVP